jgi:CRP/FNR family transcriptional regulator, cyclic AMP receptor protein
MLTPAGKGGPRMGHAPEALAPVLGAFKIFSTLDPGSLAALASAGGRKSWVAGATIFQRGDQGDYLLALTAGRVRLSLGSPTGKELVLRHVGPGEIIGELALIDGEPRSADAVAVEPTTAFVVPRARFLAAAEAHPALAMAVARYLASLLRNTNYQMESIALYDLRMRLIRFILFTVAQVHGDTPGAAPTLRLGLNQTDLSSVLGASRPKVNMALQALIAEGALTRKGEGLVCNLQLLNDLLDADDAQ